VADQKSSPPDPFTAWRDWLSQAERQLNSFFNDMMGTDQYNRAMAQLNSFAMGMQQSMNEAMGRYLNSLYLPSLKDFASLQDRLSSIESKLSAIERRSDAGVANTADPVVSGDTQRPPRTRKPPVAKDKTTS